ncbi:MAG: hypothetical protein MUF01_08465 [Bryobacterales bacterium]|nr:hypothetical protein [Bryobacterales bacterium]
MPRHTPTVNNHVMAPTGIAALKSRSAFLGPRFRVANAVQPTSSRLVTAAVTTPNTSQTRRTKAIPMPSH